MEEIKIYNEHNTAVGTVKGDRYFTTRHIFNFKRGFFESKKVLNKINDLGVKYIEFCVFKTEYGVKKGDIYVYKLKDFFNLKKSIENINPKGIEEVGVHIKNSTKIGNKEIVPLYMFESFKKSNENFKKIKKSNEAKKMENKKEKYCQKELLKDIGYFLKLYKDGKLKLDSLHLNIKELINNHFCIKEK